MTELEGAWIKETANPDCHTFALTVTWTHLALEREVRPEKKGFVSFEIRNGPVPRPWGELRSGVTWDFSRHFPVKVSRTTQVALSLAVA